MTDSVDRLATPKRPSDWLNLVARTEPDGPTNEARTQVEMDRSPNVSRAGGQDEFIDDIDDQHIAHAAKPHVYVMYWPDHGIIKAGVTGVGNARWKSWLRHGAVLLMIGDTCCMEHARRIEAFLLAELARVGGRAFTDADDALSVLGKHKGGWTECYRLVQSPRFGEVPEGSFDYERAYGLILPTSFPTEFHNCSLTRLPTTYAWQATA